MLAAVGVGAGALVAGVAYRVGPRVYNARKLARLQGRRVYDETVDGRARVVEALARASAEQKRALVVLGGNWCQWCLALDELLASDAEIARLLATRFVLLKLDGDVAEALDIEWGRPTKLGVPVLVFLNSDGGVAHIQETVSLERFGGRILLHDRDRVLTVLRAWA